jgi:PAS domain S-box-containing protein
MTEDIYNGEEKRQEPKDLGIIKGIVDIVYELDKDRNITYLNHKSEQVLGYKPGDIVGKRWSNFIMNAKILQSYKTQIERQIIEKSSKPVIRIVPFLHASGDIVTIELIEKTEFARDGSVERFYGIARDVTDDTLIKFKIEQEKEMQTKKVLEILDNAEKKLRLLATQGI